MMEEINLVCIVLKRLKNATECGRKGGSESEEEKITGGTSAVENEIPWQVALVDQAGDWLGCGAVLLSCDPVIVVTAAHCVVFGIYSQ